MAAWLIYILYRLAEISLMALRLSSRMSKLWQIRSFPSTFQREELSHVALFRTYYSYLLGSRLVASESYRIVL